MNQNFLWICTSTHYVLHYHKVSRNSVERFQRSCVDKKNRTDGLTDWLSDWLTDGSKSLYPPQLVNKIMKFNFISVIWFWFIYLQIKPPETSNVNETDGTLSYFKKKLKWIHTRASRVVTICLYVKRNYFIFCVRNSNSINIYMHFNSKA